MAHIYKITNIINDKGYVGKTIHSPKKRWKSHLYYAKSGGPMVISRAIRKHGENNFKFEVIEECLVEEINSRETYWINYHDTFHNGYNSSMGGEGAGLGVKRKRGAVHPHAKAVDCYDLKGNYLCTYNSRGEAAWETARSSRSQSINNCIEGKTFQAYGYRWTWEGEPLKEVSNRINKRGKVYGVHLESNRKKMWKSQADAAEEIHGNRKNNNDISHALNRNDKEDTNKSQVKGWYLFRDKQIALGDWKPTEHYIPTSEQAAKAGRMSKGRPNPKLWKPIKGVHIETGEIVRFNHAEEAVKRLRSDTCKLSQNNLVSNIKHQKTGETHRHAGGYRWYYDT